MKCKSCKREIADNSIFCNWCGTRQIKEATREIKVPKPRQLPSGNWFINLRVKGFADVAITEPSEALCVTKARAIKAGLIEGRSKDRRSVGGQIDAYIEVRRGKASPSTIAGYLTKRKSNLQSLMGLTVDQLTKEKMQKAIDEDMKRYSGKTIKEAVSLVRAATGKRFDGLVLPSAKPRRKPPVYSADDIRALLAALRAEGGEVECAALLAMWLSLRRSEIKGLRWADIGKDRIHVRVARVYDENHRLVEKDTKTEKSARSILCPPYIMDRIHALPRSGEFVFTRSTHFIHAGITRACEAAGIEHGYLHGLRHTNATVMALLNVPTKYAMKRGGWATPTVMNEVYTDTMDEGDALYGEAVNRFFSGLAEPDENGNVNES